MVVEVDEILGVMGSGLGSSVNIYLMSENFEMSQGESVSQTEPNLSQLKKEVQISPSTLKEITNREEFIERVVELSNNAKESINIERAKQALVYLTEAQKILQYAASCGKTIDKYIIVSVLHNEACCYQKIWELQKCSNYLQALIYNFNSFSRPDSPPDRPEHPSEALHRRTALAKYYLQYCAVNSQTDNHSGALVAGRKSIEIMKGVFRELQDTAPSLKKMNYEKKAEFDYRLRLMELGARLNDAVGLGSYEGVLAAAKYYLRVWRAQKEGREKVERHYILEEEFKNYSIGNAMQIVPTTCREFQQREPQPLTAKLLLEKVLLLALGYFTISTELRLIGGKKKESGVELRESEIYHLLSIIIAAACIPFDILYMKHVLSSYFNHYGQDLMADTDVMKGRDSKIEESLFPPIRRVTPLESLTDSIEQEESLSKLEREEEADRSSQREIKETKQTKDSKEESKEEDEKKKMKGKSKSKSKQLKSMTFLGSVPDKLSPMPKSPGAHLRSPLTKGNLIKVKTSYKLKMSTQKIVTTQHITKEEKSRKKREVRAENIEYDYFMGRSKDLKKVKRAADTIPALASPRAASKSSSKRQSPLPKQFEQPKPTGVKTLKSPKKTPTTNPKLTKANFHQYYL